MFIGRSSAASPSEPLPPCCGEVTDHAIAALRGMLSDRYGFDLLENNIRDAVMQVAIAHPFNPVVDMLAEAEANWDGVPRLDRLAVDLFNADRRGGAGARAGLQVRHHPDHGKPGGLEQVERVGGAGGRGQLFR
jgi:hypothetical protein